MPVADSSKVLVKPSALTKIAIASQVNALEMTVKETNSSNDANSNYGAYNDDDYFSGHLMTIGILIDKGRWQMCWGHVVIAACVIIIALWPVVILVIIVIWHIAITSRVATVAVAIAYSIIIVTLSITITII
ncbi:hypothetical protein AB4K20DRAFT_1868065 [Rhizopus microsporus]